MRIDAYSATVPVDAVDLIDSVQAHFREAGIGDTVCHSFNPKFYDQGVQLRDAAGVVASVQFGGNGGAHPSVQSQGEPSRDLSAFLRQNFPVHKVTRVDVAHDLVAPGLFDSFHPVLVGIGRDHRLALPRAGDWDTPGAGRTQYLGSDKAPRRMRFYEKGKQLRAMVSAPSLEGFFDPDHVRLEFQYRPEHLEQKEAAARLSPLELFGVSAWAREALEAFCGTRAPEVNLRHHREPQAERARRFMCEQYRKTLLGWLQECGSPEELGVAIIGKVRQQAKRVRRAA